MASLWWRASQYTLSSSAQDIGEVYDGIVQGLPALGYTGVGKTFDVHGSKNDFVLCVQYLYIGGQNFWQVIACGGDAGESEADAEMVKVQTMINELKFL